MKDQRKIELFHEMSLKYSDTVVFDSFNLTIEAGKITCLLGPSGCGKTSLLNLLAGSILATSGDVHKQKVSYVFQEDRLLPWKNVYDNISLVHSEMDDQKIQRILEALEIKEQQYLFPDELSGGMRQRVSMARAFYHQSDMLLMDEPFSSLDYHLRESLIQYFIKVWEERACTTLFVTHDLEEALLIAHEIILFSKKPTTILSRFKVEIPIGKRKLADEYLQSKKEKMIQILSQNKKGIV